MSKRTAGPAYQYSLQREHAAVETLLLPAIAAEEALRGLMTSELVAVFAQVAVSITLFGSAARGEDVPGSDVDVIVVARSGGVCEEVEELVEAERGRFFHRFGRPLSVHCLERAVFSAELPPFVTEAAGEGVLLFGETLTKLTSALDQP